MTAYRLGGALVAAILGVLLAVSAHAAEKVRTRAWDHQGYGRIVFDWPSAVGYSAQIVDRELVVRFDRPFITAFDVVKLNLKRYIDGIRIGEARRVIVFTLRDDFGLKTHKTANKVVIDLWWDASVGRQAVRPPPGDRAAPAIQAVPVEPVQAVPIDPAGLSDLAPAAGPMPVPRLDRVPLRYGEHPGFSRLVFDWTRWVDYKVRRRGGRAHITFDQPLAIDLTAVNRDPPPYISDLAGHRSDDTLEIGFAVPADARLRYFRSGTKVVLDVLLADQDMAAAPAEIEVAHDTDTALDPPAAPPLPEAPAVPAAPAEIEVARNAEPPPVPPAAAEPPTEAPAPEAAPPPPAGAAVAPPQPLVADPPPSPAAEKDPVPKMLVVDADPGDGHLALGFDLPAGAAAAAFRRAGFIWLVFDRTVGLDLSQVRGVRSPLLSGIEQVSVAAGTVLRLASEPGINPSLRFEADAGGWIVELKRQPLRPTDPIRLGAGRSRLMLPLEGAGEIVEIADPEVGDTLLVAPVRTPGQGVDGDRSYVEFRLLGTAQGVVIEPRTESLKIARHADGVELVGVDESLMSDPVSVGETADLAGQSGAETPPPDPGPAAQPVQPSPDTAAPVAPEQPLFDFGGWRREGPFAAVRQALHARLAALPVNQRGEARLKLAQISMANGMAAGALAALDAIASEDARLAARPEVRALRAAALFSTGKTDAAARIFAEPAFDGNREADFWRGAFAALRHDDAAAVKSIRRAGFLPADYPAKLRAVLELAAAEAALDFGDIPLAAVLMDDLLKFRTSDEQRAEIDLFRAKLLYHSDDIEAALALWQDLALGPARRTAAPAALAAVDELLRQQRIEAPEAIDRLERLRFAWRGGRFEFNLLRRLGTLYLEVGEYTRGLVALRQAVTYFPERKLEAKAVTRQMTEAFVRLLGPEAADLLPPLKALVVYDQFRELTPAGRDGDRMTQRLAERLVEVDLLDRASQVLGHQIRYRLIDGDKARVGARLAQIRLMDRRPDLALKAIRDSAADGLLRSLASDRKRLQARALSELGRGQEALGLIADDPGRDAELLRADIYRRTKDWKQVSEALARVVESTAARRAESGDDGGLGQETAQLILRLAVATVLNGDADGVAWLRKRYGAAMAARPQGAAFAMIVSTTKPPADPRDMVGDPGGIDRFESFMSKYRERLAAASTN